MEQAVRAGVWCAGVMLRLGTGMEQRQDHVGCNPKHCGSVPEPGSSTVFEDNPRNGHLTGSDSLPALFPCSPWDMTASRYQTSPCLKLPTQWSLIQLS